MSQTVPSTRLFKENLRSRECAPLIRTIYTAPQLEPLGRWQFFTGSFCEPGVVCFEPTSLERILRQGPGVGR